jgi:hypothetical protein
MYAAAGMYWRTLLRLQTPRQDEGAFNRTSLLEETGRAARMLVVVVSDYEYQNARSRCPPVRISFTFPDI